MRSRLTITITAVVAGALFVAGVGSLVLVRRADRTNFRRHLASQARIISQNIDTLVLGRALPNRKGVLTIVAEVSRLEGVAIVVIQPDGQLTPIQPAAPLLGLLSPARPLPSQLTSTQLRPALLRSGHETSGTRGSLMWVAVPGSLSDQILVPPSGQRAAAIERRLAALSTNGQVPIAVLVTGNVMTTPGATEYFLLAAAAALAVAVVVALALARRITRPLVAVRTAAGRIAAGDLEQRITVDPTEPHEITSLADSINTMTDSLRAAQTAERQFFMSVSHDLRTPLTSIRGWAEAIADGAAPDPSRAARTVNREARRLERLVQDLLDLARLDAHTFSLTIAPLDLPAVVADTAEGFRPMIERAGLTLAVEAEGSFDAAGDPDRVAQVVANLVENAYKYARSTITVRTTAATVTVEDDGPGVPVEERQHVFERLHTAGRTPARRAGSGLGLAIVKELVEAMHGSVSLDERPGGSGSRVTVALRPWSR